MIRFRLTQVDPNSDSPLKGKFVPHVVASETLDINALAEHMASHSTPFSAGAIKGMITDMVACIRELVLDGKNVKLDDLGIFSVGLESVAANSREEFSVAKNIKSVKFRARATGDVTKQALNLLATVRELDTYVGGGTADDEDVEDSTTGGGSTSGGGTTGGGSTDGGDDSGNSSGDDISGGY